MEWVILARRTRLRCAFILGIVGLLGLIVGLNDIVGVETFSIRLLALFFLVAGIFLLVSTFGLIRRTSWGPFAALTASILGATIGLILTIVQMVGDQYDYRALLWLTILLACSLCAKALLRSGVNATIFLQRMPALLSAVGIASLLPFWYTELYVPSAPEPTLVITNELTREGTTTIDRSTGIRMLAIKASVTVKNGNSRLRSIATLYKAVGHKAHLQPKGLSSKELGDRLRAPGTTLNYATYRERQLIAARSSFGAGGWIGPGEEVKRTFVFYVPEGAFDVITFTAKMWGGNGRRFTLGEACHNNNGSSAGAAVEIEGTGTRAWEIKESSSLAELTRGKRCIYSTLGLNTREDTTEEDLSSLNLHVLVDRPKSPPPQYTNLSLERLYGIFSTTANTEMSLWNEESPQNGHQEKNGRGVPTATS